MTQRTANEYTSLADQAYTELLGDITEGRMTPGSVLDRRTIAERLGMSTIPVLEAIRRLEKDGLVESRPRWPARVRVHDADFIRGEYAIREALEAQVARMCVERASDEELEALTFEGREVDELLSDKSSSEEKARQRHLEFHMGLAELTECRALIEQLEMINLRILMRRQWTRATLVSDYPDDWHARIPLAIATREPSTADEAARAHVRRGLKEELAAIERMGL